MKIKTKLFLPLIVVLIFLAGLWLLKSNFALNLYVFGIKIDATGMKMVDKFSEMGGTNKIDWIVSQSGDKKLFLGRVDTENHAKYIDDKIYLLTALFEPTTSPYPEVITNEIDCPSEYKPIKSTFEGGVMFKLYAGERYGYGICVKDLVKYNSVYGLFDCKEKGVFEIKIFSTGNPDEIEKLIKTFSCNN